MIKKTDLAYLAGLVDGEGYIGIKKSSQKDMVSPAFSARIQIRMVNEPAISFLAKILGGNYYKESAHVAKGRPLYCYQASNKKAENVLKSLLPYLRVKKEVATVVLSFLVFKTQSPKYKTKLLGYKDFKHWTGKTFKARKLGLSDEYIARCEQFYLRCKELNHL